MARCPYLSLEEEGASPFPFTSASHRCYVSRTGLPIGQREQERYCLSKRYKDCPLFLSHSLQPGLTEDLAPPVVEQRREAVTEPASGQRAEPLLTEQELAYDSGEGLVEEEPHIAVETPLEDTQEKVEVPTEAPPVKHKVAYGLGEGVVEERPQTGMGAPLQEMGEKAEIVVESPPTQDRLALGLGEEAVEERPETGVAAPLKEVEEKAEFAVESPPTQDRLAPGLGEGADEEGSEIVMEPPAREKGEKAEVVVDASSMHGRLARGLGEGVAEQWPEIVVEPPAKEMEVKVEVVEEARHSKGMVASGLGEAAIERKLKVAPEPPVREKEEKSATAAEAMPVQDGCPHELRDAVVEEGIDGVVEIAAEQVGEKPEVAAEVTPIRGKLAYGLGERVVDEDRGSVAERPDIKMGERAEVGVQAVAAEDAAVRRLGAALVGETLVHPTEPSLQQTMDRLPSQEEIAMEPVEAVVEEGPGVAVRLPSRRIEEERDFRREPLSPRKAPATRHPEAVAETRKARVQVGLLLKDADTAGTSLVSMIPKALPWVVAGGVSSTLLCVVGSILYWVLSSPPEVSMSSLELPSLWLGVVLLMLGISLVGAVLLTGLFVLTRLAASR